MTSGLVIFLKYPQLGKVKTRLAKSIGEEKALEIYRYLVHNTICKSNGTHFCELHFQGQLPKEHPFSNLTCNYQVGANIGERMFNSLDLVLKKADVALLIGTDVPEISPEIIESSLKALESADIVFGPSKDGGYYLIGMKKAHSQIFQLEKWSHSKVLDQSIEKVKSLGLTYALVKELNDVDTYQDLKAFPDLMAFL
ncbi:MAG: TIGR04282 family arsenosugar biosynthesis glycosyltransferase [Bacteroidia bacterium]